MQNKQKRDKSADLHLEQAVLLQQLLVSCLLLGSFKLPLLHHVACNGLRVCASQTLVGRVEARLGGCLATPKLVQTGILSAQALLAQLWPTLLSSGIFSSQDVADEAVILTLLRSFSQ